MKNLIDGLNLENKTYNDIIKLRYIEEIDYYQKKRDKTKYYYNFFRFSVTTGSILLPAILSIGQMDPTKLPKNFDQVSYWATWIISLLVTMSNGFLQLFSLDKNYFNYSVVVEQLKTEGWQFFSLSGKYSDFDDHQDAYKTFLKYIETIKRKQVEQEFSSSKGDKKKKPEFDFKKELAKIKKEATESGKSIEESVVNTVVTNSVNTLAKPFINSIDDTDLVNRDAIHLEINATENRPTPPPINN